MNEHVSVTEARRLCSQSLQRSQDRRATPAANSSAGVVVGIWAMVLAAVLLAHPWT
jgi:hypothetical protein